jgi:protein-S-isoprenylcysteine O-methyltransferase Ste14
MRPLPFTGVYALIFWATLVVWVQGELRVGRNNKSISGRQDQGSLQMLLFSILAGVSMAFAAPNLWPHAGILWYGRFLFAVGILLMLSGVGFRHYAIRVLGEFFTPDVAVREDQIVIDRGPYRLIRHPSYTGAMLTLLGLGLTFTNWASLAAVTLCPAVGYFYRVRVEEQALCASLGQPYSDYMKRTWRFIPYVW